MDIRKEEGKEEIIPADLQTRRRSWLGTARMLKVVLVFSAIMVAGFVMYYASSTHFGEFIMPSFSFSSYFHGDQDNYSELIKVLEAAKMKDKTVILTTLNEAWAAPNSAFDLFLESFRVGNNTAQLVNHLVVIATDGVAFGRCKAMVPHCYYLKSEKSSEMAHEQSFMAPIYLDMMWQRLAFLQTILSLGYSFVFTDTDIMWFRSPFPHFNQYADFQTSCDRFNGNSTDLRNEPSNGFLFVRSNNRTINFYKFWVASRHNYPGVHEQNVFNRIKTGPFVRKIKLRIRFLDTIYFGGYCEPSRDFDSVCTMHANCCIGLHRKIVGLNTTIEDWKNYFNSNNHTKASSSHWRVPLPSECYQ